MCAVLLTSSLPRIYLSQHAPPNSAIAGGIWGTVDLSDVGCPDSAGMPTLFYPAPEHPASISRLGRAPTLLV